MAFTTQDLAAVTQAIASGELSARVGERMVTYRSIDELIRAKTLIEADLAAQTPGQTAQTGPLRYRFTTARGW